MKIGTPCEGKTGEKMPSCPVLDIKENPNTIIGITRIGGAIILDIFNDAKMHPEERIARNIMTYYLNYAFPEEIEKRKEIIESLYLEMTKRLSDVSDQLTSEPLQDTENLRKLAQLIYFAVNADIDTVL